MKIVEDGRFLYGRRKYHHVMLRHQVEKVVLNITKLMEIFRVVQITSTVLSFLACCFLLPSVILVFLVFKIHRTLARKWLQIRNWRKDISVDIGNERLLDEHNEDPPVQTFLLVLKGNLQKDIILDSVQDFMDTAPDEQICSRLRSILSSEKGFAIWRKCDNFHLKDHIFEGEKYHRGILTERKIQEQLSEMCSEPLLVNKPPWQIQWVAGVQGDGSPCTWVLLRSHRLLVESLQLSTLSTSFPTSWNSVDEIKAIRILTSPSVIRQTIRSSLEWVSRCFFLLIVHIYDLYLNFESVLYSIAREIVHCYNNTNKLHQKCKCWSSSMNKIPRSVIIERYTHVRKLIQVFFHNTVAFPNSIINFIKTTMEKNAVIVLTVKSCIMEIYWILRALVCVPQLMTEQWLLAQQTKPLACWSLTSRKEWSRNILSWSDELSLNSLLHLKKNTGSCVTSVLLASVTGGLKDLVRYCGSFVPPVIRCTLPVFTRMSPEITGIVALDLPTGTHTNEKSMLHISKSLDSIEKHPERLIAKQIMLNFAYSCLPNFILDTIVRKIRTCYPVLLTHLIGPEEPTQIWNLDVLKCFMWRPPQNDAVLSICLTSYQNKISIGVIGNGWAVPHASLLIRHFFSHYHQLSSEHGVQVNTKRTKLAYDRTPRNANTQVRRRLSKVLDPLSFQCLVSSLQQCDRTRPGSP